jgi:hypothetical protein
VNAGAHVAHDFQNAGARRVRAHVPHGHAGAWHKLRRNQQKCGRGNVTGHVQFLSTQLSVPPGRVNFHHRAHGLDRRAHREQHALGVITTHVRLTHNCNAVRVQSRKEERALDLRTRDRALIFDRAQVCIIAERTKMDRRSDFACLRGVRRSVDDRATRSQWTKDAHHRTSTQ